MQSEEALRAPIRERLASGILPGGDCTKVFGGPSNGETCDGCGEPVAKNGLVMECIGPHFQRLCSSTSDASTFGTPSEARKGPVLRLRPMVKHLRSRV